LCIFLVFSQFASFPNIDLFILPMSELKLQSVMPCDLASLYPVSCSVHLYSVFHCRHVTKSGEHKTRKSCSPWICLSSEEATRLGQRRRTVVCSTYPLYRGCHQDGTETPFSKTGKSRKTRSR
jgi:hypothetical protein